jgi:hypothetical protein
MRQFQTEIAFRFLQKGEFEKAFTLLTQSEADPRLLLSIVQKQQPQIDLNLENANGLNLPIQDENFPEIPLTMVEEYLQRVLRHSMDGISPIEIQVNPHIFLNIFIHNYRSIENLKKIN